MHGIALLKKFNIEFNVLVTVTNESIKASAQGLPIS